MGEPAVKTAPPVEKPKNWTDEILVGKYLKGEIESENPALQYLVDRLKQVRENLQNAMREENALKERLAGTRERIIQLGGQNNAYIDDILEWDKRIHQTGGKNS